MIVSPSRNGINVSTLEDAYALFRVKSACYGHDRSSGLMAILQIERLMPLGN
jgi:hypothetical protein